MRPASGRRADRRSGRAGCWRAWSRSWRHRSDKGSPPVWGSLLCASRPRGSPSSRPRLGLRLAAIRSGAHLRDLLIRLGPGLG
jgi:hypothetical protein